MYGRERDSDPEATRGRVSGTRWMQAMGATFNRPYDYQRRAAGCTFPSLDDTGLSTLGDSHMSLGTRLGFPMHDPCPVNSAGTMRHVAVTTPLSSVMGGCRRC